MRIKVEFNTQIRAAIGTREQTVDAADGSTLTEVLKQIFKAHSTLTPWIDSTGAPKPGLLIFVNDQAPTDGMQTKLKANDCVSLMTMVSGG